MTELGTGFTLGIFATLSPCALPLYPGFLAYLGARTGTDAGARWLGFAVLAGVLSAMLVLGACIALLAVSIGSVLRIVTPLADVVVIALGILLLFGRNPFAALPTVASSSGGRGLRAAYVYGLLYGPIALPCSAPLLVALFGLGLGLADFIRVLAFFLAFGLGFGLPLLALSLLASSSQLALMRHFTRHHVLVGRIAGAVLLAVGLADLATNVPLLLLAI